VEVLSQGVNTGVVHATQLCQQLKAFLG
jgi:hypothetical protein